MFDFLEAIADTAVDSVDFLKSIFVTIPQLIVSNILPFLPSEISLILSLVMSTIILFCGIKVLKLLV